MINEIDKVVNLDVIEDSNDTGITHCKITLNNNLMSTVVKTLELLQHTPIEFELCALSIQPSEGSKIELFQNTQKINIDNHTKKHAFKWIVYENCDVDLVLQFEDNENRYGEIKFQTILMKNSHKLTSKETRELARERKKEVEKTSSFKA